MSRILLFTTKYEAQLKANAQAGLMDAYASDTFAFDKAQTNVMNIEIDDDICDRMYGESQHDYEDAITLYESLKDIPEVVAADQTFWISLSHTILYPYLKKRWGKEDMKSTVLGHWFFENGMMRHGLSSLWWSVRLTHSTKYNDTYRLTKVLFWNYSFRTTFMGPSIFWRVSNARIGILEYLADHETCKDNFENKGRYIAKYFNLLGATKHLSALPSEYFYKEMEKNLDLMNTYRPRDKSDDAIEE